MISLTITYPFLRIFNRKLNIDIPDNWLDLSARQFSVCSDAITKGVSDDDYISKFFGLKPRLVKQLSDFEKYKLIACTEFIHNPRAVVNFFYITSISGTDLLSPNERLKGVSFEHFMLFDTYFFDYVNESTFDNLCRFVSALYLKKGEVLTTIDFQSRVKYVSEKVDKSMLDAIFLNYTFIRKWLSTVFRFLFEYNEPDEEDSKPTKNTNVSQVNRPNWNLILDGFIGDDVLNEQKYRDIACIRAFKTINTRIKTYKSHGKS